MPTGLPAGFGPIDPLLLEKQLRLLAERRPQAGVVDDLELRHLVGVILHGALLFQDMYSNERVGPVMSSDPRSAARNLIAPLFDADPLHQDLGVRIGRLPEDVRQLGDKCLFDIGISRIRAYRGLDLQELGVRAYRMASEILAVLAEDERLREFFDRNSLGPLPIGDEITFLRQCANRFAVHADLLHELRLDESPGNDTAAGIVVPRPLSDSVIGAPRLAPKPPAAPQPADGAARATEATVPADREWARLSRDELLSSYERLVLFASVDLEAMKRSLNARVIDQPVAVEALCEEFALYATGTHSLTKPPSYFFVGPTGVGKNYLIESLAVLLEGFAGVAIPVLTIDGPNYTDASDINELRGSTRGFIRSDEPGLLAEFHERSARAPLSIILVDEVEKAHPHLRKFFLSLMDRGTVTDNRGRALDFANCMIVFTSNLGYSEAAARGAPIGYRGDEAVDDFENAEVTKSLRQALSAEFVNRLRIIRFAHLSRASIDRIFDLEFGRIARRFRDLHGLEVVVTEAAREAIIARGYSHAFGARHLASVLERVANVEVSKRLKKDDTRSSTSDGAILEYLREVRSETRAFDPEEMRSRVLGAARVRVPYRTLTIDVEAGEFVYRT